MKRKNSFSLLIGTAAAMVFCGCDYFLPPGDPPPGTIVVNPEPGKEVPVMTADAAVAAFVGELTNLTLMYARNQQVFIDADRATIDAARNILQQCADLSGVSVAAKPGRYPIFYSRFDRESKLWEIKFFAADRKLLHHSVIKLIPSSR